MIEQIEFWIVQPFPDGAGCTDCIAKDDSQRGKMKFGQIGRNYYGGSGLIFCNAHAIKRGSPFRGIRYVPKNKAKAT